VSGDEQQPQEADVLMIWEASNVELIFCVVLSKEETFNISIMVFICISIRLLELVFLLYDTLNPQSCIRYC
jgi:hypothetical protein